MTAFEIESQLIEGAYTKLLIAQTVGKAKPSLNLAQNLSVFIS